MYRCISGATVPYGRRLFQRAMSCAAAPRKSALYTRGGDGGHSSLFTGERRRKDDAVFCALGALDEANAQIGVARELLEIPQIIDQLQEIQSALLDAGAAVATPLDTASEKRKEVVAFDADSVKGLEKCIDELDREAGPLTQFILPGGGVPAAQLHVARAVVRRAERAIVPLVLEERVDPQVGVYINRLSDYMFAAARVVAKRNGILDVLYVSRRRRKR